MNKLYTAQEVADRLKIRKNTVYELIKRGELHSSKIGKQLRVSEEQLMEYLNGSVGTSAVEALPPSEYQPESSLLKRDYLLHSNGLILSGQASAALDLLLSQVSVHPQGIPVLQTHMNSYNSLYALYFGKTHIASASLSPEEIQHLAPGLSLTAVCLYEYMLGFYVRRGNPRNIHCIRDLTRPDITLVNREKGSTRRIFLDQHLKKHRIASSALSVSHRELVSDISTAAAVSSGQADVAIGEQHTVRNMPEIDFVPLEKMPMYLVMETASVHRQGFSAILEIIKSREFQSGLNGLTGYDTDRSGETLLL